MRGGGLNQAKITDIISTNEEKKKEKQGMWGRAIKRSKNSESKGN